MQNLNSQIKAFSFVIDESITNISFNIEYLLKRIQEWVNIRRDDERTLEEYYYILHDLDTDDNGELKTKHIHLLYSLSKRVRAKTELNALCDFLFGDCKYVNLISIDKWRYHDEGIQYLCHNLFKEILIVSKHILYWIRMFL